VDIANRAFLETTFADALPGAHTIITGFRGDPNEKDREKSRRMWCGRPWQPGQTVPWDYRHCNSYFTVSTFEPLEEIDRATGEALERRRRRKESFLQMHVAMVDDVGTGPGSKVAPSKLVLAPSTLIETSPRNFQACYLLTDEPGARDLATCERLINRMVAAGLAMDARDPGMKGVTRFARLPQGVNGKAKYIRQLGHPFAVRLDTFEPMRRYRIAEIAAAYGLDMTPEPPRTSAMPVTTEQAKRALASFEGMVKFFQVRSEWHGEHGAWHDITCPWIEDHTDRVDTGAAICAPSDSNAWFGGFVCHHGSHNGDRGQKKTMLDVVRWVREQAERAAYQDFRRRIGEG
jgi:hypothetical protein